MSRNNNFRIRQKDIERLSKLSQSAKRKGNRLKRNFDLNLTPDIKTIDEFSSRKDFNKYVKQLETFTDRKSHRYRKNAYGDVFSYDDVRKATQFTKTYNKTREKVASKILGKEFYDRKKASGFSVGESRYSMGDTRYYNVRPKQFDINNFRSTRALRQFTENTKKAMGKEYLDKINKDYKRRYLKGLKTVFGRSSSELRKHIKDMDVDRFMEIYYTDNVGDIRFMYDKFHQDALLREIEMIFLGG